MNEDEALSLVRAMLDADEDPQQVLDAASEAMTIIGNLFDERDYFLPELIVAGEMMTTISDLVKSRLRAEATLAKTLGTVLIGTVAGDIHDIGKDVVAYMLDVNSFKVHDAGVDVSAATFVAKILELRPGILGLSGFMTAALDQMKLTGEALREAGLREAVKIMMGGAITSEEAVDYVGADAYGVNAAAAVKLARSWVA